ncbi:hypothetical protein RhiJN_20145 [Ceratobasidium sp. AG-Ba]|nr:hypothetical protein RhiJN_20145 [Ceratobasidium sp. AG-Ba]
MSVPSSPCYLINEAGLYLAAPQGEPNVPLILVPGDNPGEGARCGCSSAPPNPVTRSEANTLSSSSGVKFTPDKSIGYTYRFVVEGKGEPLMLGQSPLRMFPPMCALVPEGGFSLDWEVKPKD